MRSAWLSVGLVVVWALVGVAQCSEIPYTVGGTTVTLRFCGNLVVSGGTCSQVASNVVQCSVPEGTTGTVSLSAQRTPAGTVSIGATLLPGWASFTSVSGWGSVSGQCRFTVPTGTAGQRFELKFQASASGVPSTINLTVILDVVRGSVPPPPGEYQPVTGTTDSGGNFTVSIAPNTTVTGKLTICTVTPLSNLTFTLTPVVTGFDGGAISGFKIAAPGYEDLLVTDFSKFDLFIIATYDLRTLCLKPGTGQPGGQPGDGEAAPGCFHAFWTHGSGVQLENTESVVSVTRLGYYTRVVGKPNASGWFHFAIPTPVIGTCYSAGAGQEVQFRYRLWRVLVTLRTSGPDVLVTRIHIWDGDLRRAVYDNLSLSGFISFDKYAWQAPDRPPVIYGIGVSIHVQFPLTGGTVDFIGAGGDFLLSDSCTCR